MLTIVGGLYRGKKLISPAGAHVRPTSGRSREALFNMLESHTSLKGKTVADLYCGSGALGLEALSRGAEKALFADKDPRTAKKNAELMQVAPQAIFLKEDVLTINPTKLADCTVIFIDPPYGDDLAAKTIAALAPHLNSGTLWAVEVEADYPLAALPFAAANTPLKLLGKSTHGAAAIAVFQQSLPSAK